MVVTARGDATPPSDAELAVIWHDLECGGYRADLPLWHQLAASSGDGATGGAILEIGAGSGRVALDLAAAGHEVTALDLDDRLLDSLRARASGLDVEAVCADARSFELKRRDFGLCLAPMQTVQLLGGEAGRIEFLRRARAHLRPGGLLACAIVTEFEFFDCSGGGAGPTAETVRLHGTDYVSRAIRICPREEGIVIERARRILPGGREAPPEGSARLLRLGARSPTTAGEKDVIELDLVSVEQLEREGIAAGLRPAVALRIEATEEYLGSDVVMLRA
ncbi:MAG TPA: class I SAM-dependent methyltransferase [Solirubrobacteraceae bacterium]|jgi:SAM-dependent methyltransferase|nr:class I SAM-dependent methyltransferase [Solirubrobacteraceae bacterium]